MPDAPLQFETAEYAGQAPTCTLCGASVGSHYLVGAHVVCPACRGLLLEQSRPAGGPELVRGALFGLGAAVTGSAAWYAVSVATGAEWGIVALAVSWFVAWSIRRGAGGGRVQQAMAVSLTYLAIVGAQLPHVWQPGGEIAALFTVLLLPVWLLASADVSTVLWFVIAGIALWGAWQRTAGTRIDFTGPFSAREGT